MTGTQNLAASLQTKATVLAVSGTVGFVAAKFVFDASTGKAILVGAIIAAIGVGLISISVPTAPNIVNP